MNSVRILSGGFAAVRRGGGGRGGAWKEFCVSKILGFRLRTPLVRGHLVMRHYSFTEDLFNSVNTLYYTVIKHKEVLRWLNEHQKSLSTLSRHIKCKISPKIRGRYFRVFGRCGRKNFFFLLTGAFPLRDMAENLVLQLTINAEF